MPERCLLMKAVLFDLDGTLLDSIAPLVKSWKLALEKFGLKESDRTIRKLLGLSAPEIVERIAGTLPPEERKRLNEVRREIYEDLWPKEAKLYPDAVEVLEALRKKYKLAVISSNKRDRLLRKLKHFKLEKYFDAVVSYEDVGKGKPEPDMVLRTCEELEVLPSEAAVVGDAIYDVEMAKRAGSLSILVLREGCEHDFAKQHPDRIVLNLKALLSFL